VGRWNGTNGASALGVGIFAAAAAAAAALLIYEGRGVTFTGDEWAYAGHLVTQSGADRLLTSPGSDYAMPVPLLMLDGMLNAFGMTSYVPYRLVGVAAHLVCAGLLFLLLRRRVGAVPAALATVPILFLAASDDGMGVDAVTMSARRLPMLLAIGFGLGALLALEHRSRGRDAAACGLLVLSLASHPVGLGFAAIAAVTVFTGAALRRSPRALLTSRALVFAVPLALWVAVSLLFGHGNSDLSAGNLVSVPAYMAESLAAASAAVAGMANSPLVSGSTVVSGAVPWLLAAGAVGACAWTVARRMAAGDRHLPTFWAAAAGLGVLLLATAIQPGSADIGSPEAPRYVYPEAILLVLVLAEAFRGVSVRPRLAAVMVASVALAVTGSALQLFDMGSGMRSLSLAERAELGAIEAAARVRAEVASRSPTQTLLATRAGTNPLGNQLAVPRRYALGGISAYVITRLADRYGSPALDADEIDRVPTGARDLADALYVRLIRAGRKPLTAPDGATRPLCPAGAAPRHRSMTAAQRDARSQQRRARLDRRPRSLLVPVWYRCPDRADRQRQ
jgi:hypothetical protein